jgi:serine/threonine protein kinase
MRIAFENKVIHRDLKPDNIIVRSLEPPDVVTVDYGLSFNHAIEVALTRASETFDNEFLSLPERRVPDGDRRDPRSDLTGLCAVFLFCLTGQRPVDLRDSSDKAPHRRPGCSIAERVGDALRSQAVEAFFDRGFAVSIEDRFQTIGEFLKRLDEILDPKIKAASDDPTELAQRFSAQLLREDRKTQIASFARGAESLIERIGKTASRLGSKLGAFALNVAKVPDNLPQPPGTSLKRGAMLRMWNGHHPDITQAVAYDIRAQGTECVLYRVALTPKDRSVREAALKGEWEAILRYDGFGDRPDPGLLADEAVEAVNTMLRTLQERILAEPQA